MRSQSRIFPPFATAILCSGITVSVVLLASPPRAQNTAPSAAVVQPGTLPMVEVPFYAEWASSPHAHRAAEPFNHWNKEGSIPVECARCHSTPWWQVIQRASDAWFSTLSPDGKVTVVSASVFLLWQAMQVMTVPTGAG